MLLLWAALLLAFPGQSLEGARKGVSLCLDLIIPSLFPFFVLSSLLIATGFASMCARLLSGLLSPLFGVGGSGAAALLLGAVGGYPVGARTLSQMVKTGECSEAEARRLSLFCNNCGPAFFIGAVGAGVFGSREAGMVLLGANLTAALLVGLIARIIGGKLPPSNKRAGSTSKPFPGVWQAFPDSVQSAFSASLGVCAYVILFSVLIMLLDRIGWGTVLTEKLSGRLPMERGSVLLRALLTGLLEMSTGTAALAEGAASPAALPLAGFLLGWGGLSVFCQTLPFWREAGVPSLPYLGAKLGQGLISAGIVAVWVHFFPLTVPVMAVSASPFLPSLFREVTVLWGLAGVLWLRQRQRGQKKRRTPAS